MMTGVGVLLGTAAYIGSQAKGLEPLGLRFELVVSRRSPDGIDDDDVEWRLA